MIKLSCDRCGQTTDTYAEHSMPILCKPCMEEREQFRTGRELEAMDA